MGGGGGGGGVEELSLVDLGHASFVFSSSVSLIVP